jgi:Na+-transporting methylmalonyl-CoA/oxaloacetate decarboxylase gamma subunit
MTRKFIIPVLILLIQAGASAQQTAPSDLRILSGRVVELAYEGEDTVGLQGVRVYQLGSNRYTQTDVDGYFSLELPDSTLVVKIELFGYRNKEVQVHKGETSAMVVIERNLSFMEDEGLLITVVGMGVVFSALILLFLLFKFLLPVVNGGQRKKKAAADAHPGKFTVVEPGPFRRGGFGHQHRSAPLFRGYARRGKRRAHHRKNGQELFTLEFEDLPKS